MDFDKVLKELQIGDDELKKLVSAGQIKAFREDDQMKFKRDDVDALKNKSQDAEESDVIDLLDEDDSLDTSDEDLTQDLSFDEDFGSELSGDEADDLLVDEVADDEEVDLVGLELDEGDLDDGAGGGATARTSTRERRIVGKSKISAMAEAEEEDMPQWALALSVVSVIALIFGVFIMIDIASGVPSPVVEWLVGMVQS